MIIVREKTRNEVGDCNFCNTPTQFGIGQYVPNKKVYLLESDQIGCSTEVRLCPPCLAQLRAVTGD